ncbi:SMC-Scp complex subunit ScpB [Salinisphaera sp. LB1]|uniref:SMC-Scp complex subunit ScpB n=1 Tax=Salinisphaera sp. LB1 TaxID=2183911 RepID=UPI000D705EE3|nr:SMC-Scp complex subunit ScpB [Salinisphaera sp. LB1]AWN17572.1 Segregation and condensation protein B [Salinisphaera sp. LB1]
MTESKPSPEAGAARTSESPEVSERLVRCIEALLLAADSPLSVDQLVRLLETTDAVDKADVRTALSALAGRYADSAADLVEVAGGWRFQVGPDYGALVARLWEERPPKLSRAMLETLAIICYRQPLARSDIEAVRGVSVSTGIIKTLSEYEWIKVVGHREVPGRPALYATTPRFLDDFGVKRLADLPSLPELKDVDTLDAAVARLRGDADDGDAGTPEGSTDVPPDDRADLE